LKLLVVAPSWIGDAVCSQPLLTRLAARHPGAAIDVLAPAWVGPVYRRMAEVGEVLSNPFRHGELKLSARLALARDLRRRGYDEAVVLPNSFKSALVPWLARIPRRTGFTGEARMVLLNHRHRLDKAKTPLQVQRYAQLAQPLGAPLPEPLPPLRLKRDATSEAATRAALALATPRRWCSAPAPNTAPPSACRHATSPPWRSASPARRRRCCCWARPRTRRWARKSPPQRKAAPATCAAPPAWTRPWTSSPRRPWWSPTTRA